MFLIVRVIEHPEYEFKQTYKYLSLNVISSLPPTILGAVEVEPPFLFFSASFS